MSQYKKAENHNSDIIDKMYNSISEEEFKKTEKQMQNEIKTSLKYKGLSVIVRTKDEFDIIKKFLGEYLYLQWYPQMKDTLTAVIIHYDDEDFFSIGSVGSADYQELNGCRLVDFSEFFKF